MIAVIDVARGRWQGERVRLLVVAVALALTAGCSDDAGGGSDLAVDVRDLAVADLAPTPCPATFSMYPGACVGDHTVCRYSSDAGPDDHLICLGGHWQSGTCPFGPGYTTEFSGCTRDCYEFFGEAYTTCTCLPSGIGVCCIDTGFPNCGNFDAGP